MEIKIHVEKKIEHKTYQKQLNLQKKCRNKHLRGELQKPQNKKKKLILYLYENEISKHNPNQNQSESGHIVHI